MATRPKKRPATLAAATVILMTTLLSGCAGSTDKPSGGAAGSNAGQAESTSPGGEATPDPSATQGTDGGFPSCDEVKAALGPEVAGLIELPASENGVKTGSTGPALGCAWHTPETNGENIHIEEYGGISVGIERDPSYTEESMEPLGWIIQDPRVSAAGAWALKPGGQYDPSAQLDVTGVQVVRDGIVVVFTSGGAALQNVPQLASLTNEWALGGGVALLDLMD